MTTILLICTILMAKLATANGQPECITGELDTTPGPPHDPQQMYLRYCFNGQWLQLCGVNAWSSTDAKVACTQLGYVDVLKSDVDCPRAGIANDTRIDGVRLITGGCTGSELTLNECMGGLVTTQCQCNSSAWLTCKPDCSDGNVRLVNGTTNREGRVEVCQSDRWGTVCGEGWGDREAGLVCRELGFPAEGGKAVTNVFAPGFTSILNCIVSPEGNLSCVALTDASCDHTMDVGVVCRTYQELYTDTQAALEQLKQECDSTPTLGTAVTCAEEMVTISDNIDCEFTPFYAVIGALAAVIIAMAIGWLCTCFLLRHRTPLKRVRDPLSERYHQETITTEPSTRADANNLQTETNIDTWAGVSPVKYEVVGKPIDNPHTYSSVLINKGAQAEENGGGRSYHTLVHSSSHGNVITSQSQQNGISQISQPITVATRTLERESNTHGMPIFDDHTYSAVSIGKTADTKNSVAYNTLMHSGSHDNLIQSQSPNSIPNSATRVPIQSPTQAMESEDTTYDTVDPMAEDGHTYSILSNEGRGTKTQEMNGYSILEQSSSQTNLLCSQSPKNITPQKIIIPQKFKLDDEIDELHIQTYADTWGVENPTYDTEASDSEIEVSDPDSFWVDKVATNSVKVSEKDEHTYSAVSLKQYSDPEKKKQAGYSTLMHSGSHANLIENESMQEEEYSKLDKQVS